MKRTLSIVLLLLGGLVSLAQETFVERSTKSYLITDYNPKDTAFLKDKCRHAGLDLGLSVLANRVPTNSRHVSPKPSKHLLKQGVLQLQLPIDDKQTEFAVYHSDLFDQPTNINVLQIGDELITYRTSEKSGDNQMVQTEAKKLGKTDHPLLIFNNLKSYAYNEFGDEAIRQFLDTIHKYNPEKHIQADLLTPASWPYLSRVNENQIWHESMRTKIIETLTEKQDFYRKNLIPWMIGNFQILLADKNRKATTLEELEWFLSKAAAFDAGFGLDFSAETMKKHGLTDAILNTVNIWESLRLDSIFSAEQKEMFKDPYGNWHLEKADDSTYLLYNQHISRRYFCNFSDDRWEWNSPYAGRFAMRIAVEGKGSISDPVFNTPNGELVFPCTLKAGQYLNLDFDGAAYITDLNFNKIEKVEMQGNPFLNEGLSEVLFTCTMKPQEGKNPLVTVRYFTRNESPQMMVFP